MSLPAVLGFTGAEGDAPGDAVSIGAVYRDTTTSAGSWSLASWRCEMSTPLTVMAPYGATITPSGVAAEAGGVTFPQGYQRAYSFGFRFHFNSPTDGQFAVVEDRDSANITNRLVLIHLDNTNQGQLVFTDKNGVRLSGLSKILVSDTWYRLSVVLSPNSPTSYYFVDRRRTPVDRLFVHRARERR